MSQKERSDKAKEFNGFIELIGKLPRLDQMS